MAVSIRVVIDNALYLSKLADRELSDINNQKTIANVALDRFLEVADMYKELVPYFFEKQITGLENVGASSINYVDYILSKGSLRYNLKKVGQAEFRQISVVPNVKSIPLYYYHDLSADKLQVYPLPMSSSDTFNIGYTPSYSNCDLDAPLSTAVTPALKRVIEYAIARELAAEYEVKWSALKEQNFQKALERLSVNTQAMLPKNILPSVMAGGRTSTVPWLAYISGNLPQ